MGKVKVSEAAETIAATAVNGQAKHTITITFSDKDKALYDAIVAEAEADERPIAQFVLRELRESFIQRATEAQA